jgi:transposase-like protein
LPKARRPAGRRGVSRLCEEIDERVGAFLNRPLEGDWPYLWPPHAAGCMGTRRIDATYVKVRQIGRIVSVAVIIAVGVNTDGRREVLGMSIGASEAETFWVDRGGSVCLNRLAALISGSSAGFMPLREAAG